MDLLLKYFPELTGDQQEKFRRLAELVTDWNSRINLISRKDIPHLFERHILHSLAIARIIHFAPGTRVLDVGTGGGFPGIPLSILFPSATFTLVDSTAKKIRVVQDIASELDLGNVTALNQRAETLDGSYHFIVSRAVTAFPKFYSWIGDKIDRHEFNSLKNGILYLKGGEFGDEIATLREKIRIYDIARYFSEAFFETKKIIYLPGK